MIAHANYASAGQENGRFYDPYRMQSNNILRGALASIVVFGSSGGFVCVSEHTPMMRHIGSSSSVVDRRPARGRTTDFPPADRPAEVRSVIALSVVEQLKELLAALSINKSQLARILCVSRPTIYEWFQGKAPNPGNTDRLNSLVRVVHRASVRGAKPLNARFVRKPMDLNAPSIIELLEAEPLDEDRIVRALRQARTLGGAETKRRMNREERLRSLGFEERTNDERRETLAQNMAMQDWPIL